MIGSLKENCFSGQHEVGGQGTNSNRESTVLESMWKLSFVALWPQLQFPGMDE